MAVAQSLLTTRRRRSDLGRAITPYTSNIVDSTERTQRDLALENPWIGVAVVPEGAVADETHWLTMESDPAVSGAIATRIAQLLGGGVSLQAGEGDGAQELLEFWEDHLAELPLVTMSVLGLMSFFRGWRPFELVGANRPWNGQTVFAPIVVRNALSWHFRWTVGRDLFYRPGGFVFAADRPPYRMNLLSAQMKWFVPAMGDLSNPYGFPIHRNWMGMDVAHRELNDIGMSHIRTSNGVLTIEEGGQLGANFTAQEEAKIQAVGARVKSFIDEMQSGGALVKPEGWNVDWLALPSAVGGWVGLFEFFRAAAMSYYAQSNLSTSSLGSSASRALVQVQDQVGRRTAKLDACQYQEQFRRWLRAWSAANASVIAPNAFPGTGIRPRLLDVPLRAVPHLVFNSLNRITADDLAVLSAIHDIGVEIPEGLTEEEKKAARVMVPIKEMLASHTFPIAKEDHVGAILDFSKKPAPVSPFPGNPRALEQDPADLDQDPEDGVEGLPSGLDADPGRLPRT